MAYQQRAQKKFDPTNTGSAWKNEEKIPGDENTAHFSDYKGSLNVEGVEYFLDITTKTVTNEQSENFGKRFLSVKVNRKKKQPSQQRDELP